MILNSNGEPKSLMYDYDGTNYYFKGGDAIYEDVNHDGQINGLDVVYLGNANPKFQGGFGFNFFYGDWSLKTSFSFRTGMKVVNRARQSLEEMYGSYNQLSSVNWRWRKSGDITQMPRALYESGWNSLGSDRYVEDASFVRLSYVQLNYNFNKKLLKAIGLRRLQLSLSAQNLFVLSKYSGIEPEVAPKTWGVAYDNSSTPRSKSVTLNVNIGF